MKNKVIPSAKNAKYRPTSSFVREAIFNILYSLEVNLEDCNVLDLFAGTGSVAFEALSRGAQSATLIDINWNYVDEGQKFILQNRLNAKYLRLDVTLMPTATQEYNIVFLDPPYSQNPLQLVLNLLLQKKWLAKDAIVIAELSSKASLILPQEFTLVKNKKYKSAQLLVIKTIN